MNILGIIIALIVLGVLVAVHELGHLIGAKIGGIGVDEFSIGMGRELFGFNWKGTRYRFGWIPFGGFCRMRGEETKDRDAADTKKDGEATVTVDADDSSETEKTEKTPDPTAMYNRPAWARVIAVFFGPFFNYIFAVLIMMFLYLFGFHEETVAPYVSVMQRDTKGYYTPAYMAGLQDGDLIIQINDKSITTYSEVVQEEALNIDKELGVLYVRGGLTNYTTVIPVKDPERGLGYIGVAPLYTTVIGGVAEASPAAGIGIQAGDKIVAFNGQKIEYYYELQNHIESSPNKEVVLTIERDGETFDKTVTLAERTRDADLETGQLGDKVGFLGIYPGKALTFDDYRKAKNFFHAIALGFTESNNLLKQTWDGLKAIFSGKIDVQKNISGPIRIIQFTGKIATTTNFATLLQFVAMISVALGFFNLLPLPGLDGGHVVLNSFEMITTIKPGEKVLRAVEYAGLFMIITLAVLVFFSDILNIIKGR